jgi:hypothetical protein
MVAGLYFVAMGLAVYGESMFTKVRDGSKIALSALIAHCRAHEVPQLDCQQVTAHLSRLGARPVLRALWRHFPPAYPAAGAGVTATEAGCACPEASVMTSSPIAQSQP